MSELTGLPRGIFALDNKRVTVDPSKNVIIKGFLEARESNPVSLDSFDAYLAFDSVTKESFLSYLKLNVKLEQEDVIDLKRLFEDNASQGKLDRNSISCERKSLRTVLRSQSYLRYFLEIEGNKEVAKKKGYAKKATKLLKKYEFTIPFEKRKLNKKQVSCSGTFAKEKEVEVLQKYLNKLYAEYGTLKESRQRSLNEYNNLREEKISAYLSPIKAAIKESHLKDSTKNSLLQLSDDELLNRVLFKKSALKRDIKRDLGNDTWGKRIKTIATKTKKRASSRVSPLIVPIRKKWETIKTKVENRLNKIRNKRLEKGRNNEQKTRLINYSLKISDLKARLKRTQAELEKLESNSNASYNEKQKIREEIRDLTELLRQWRREFAKKNDKSSQKKTVFIRSRKEPSKRTVPWRAIASITSVIAIICLFAVAGAFSPPKAVPLEIQDRSQAKLSYTMWEYRKGTELDPALYQTYVPIINETVWVDVFRRTKEYPDRGLVLGFYEPLLEHEKGYESDLVLLAPCLDEDLNGVDDETGGKAKSYGLPSDQFYNKSLVLTFKVLDVDNSLVVGECENRPNRLYLTLGYATDYVVIACFVLCSLFFLYFAFRKDVAKARSTVRLSNPAHRLSKRTKSVLKAIFVGLFFLAWIFCAVAFSDALLSVLFAGFLLVLFVSTFSNLKKWSDELKRTKKVVEKSSRKTKTFLCSVAFVACSILWFVFTVMFNSVLLGIAFGVLMALIISVSMPSSKRLDANRELRESFKESFSIRKNTTRKNQRKKLFRGTRTRLNKDPDQSNNHTRFLAFVVSVCCILFPTLIGWFEVNIASFECPEPTFALVPQDLRRNGIDYNAEELNYTSKIDDLKEIPFNHEIVLKFNLTLPENQRVKFYAELVPDGELDLGGLSKVKYGITRVFNTKNIVGKCKNKMVYLPIDLGKEKNAVVPGKYKLRVYCVQNYFLSLTRESKAHEYDVEISKDAIRFVPAYSNDPSYSTRVGSCYSKRSEDLLGYNNYFECKMEDSLGTLVDGRTVGLYITQREGFAPVFKKVDDYDAKNGIINYKYVSRSHFREYQQSKIEFIGDSDLFYKSATHVEDCEIAKDKFAHTASYGNLDQMTYNGTSIDQYNKNEFKLTSHLFYLYNCHPEELQWEHPYYDYDAGETNHTDLLRLDVTTSTTSSIESPPIYYLGTKSDISKFTYCFNLEKDVAGTEDVDKIHVKIKTQLYRDNELVREKVDYDDNFNVGDFEWKVINDDFTEFFDEGGRAFKIKIVSNFTIDPTCDDDLSLFFDYCKLECFYTPTYYRGFNFNNGFNDLASPAEGTSEANYWDMDHPIVLGNNILDYINYPGLLDNYRFERDFRSDNSWNIYSGLFSTDAYGNPIFTRDDNLNLPPTWGSYGGNGMAIFDLHPSKPNINVSDSFNSVKIQDEFTSIYDTDTDRVLLPYTTW